MRRRLGIRKVARGFTLLELLVALNVFAVGILLGVFPMLITAIQMNKIAFQRTVATELARDALDNFANIYAGVPWANITGNPAGNSDPPGFTGPAGFCPPAGAWPHADNPNNPFHRHTFYRNNTRFSRGWQIQTAPEVGAILFTVYVFWDIGERSSGMAATSDFVADTENCARVVLSSYKYCDLGDNLGLCQ